MLFKTLASSCFVVLLSVATLNAQTEELIETDDFSQETVDSEVVISEHVTVYPALDPDSRNIQCSCWIEPDDTYTLFTNSNMDDGSTASIGLPFNLELFGQTYNSFWININGHVTFDEVPSGFFVDADFPDGRVMLAPCHSDIDLTCGTCGDIYYKVTEDAVFINWVDVGHFNATSDQVQRFQLIFTSNASELLEGSNNVQFCYQDMQWTLTDSSNSIEIGASGGNATDNIEFGFFTEENSAVYDGPFGNDDGIDWLDYKAITFDSSTTNSENTPPISVGSIECDTIRLCQDDTEEIQFEFLAPELSQAVTVSVDDGGFSNLILNTDDGAYATANLLIDSDGVPPGFYEITVTATDNGSPAASTETTVIIEVIAESIPDLDIYYENEIVSSVSYCSGQEPPFLSGTEGFDCYLWSNGSELQTDQFTQGVYNLTAFWMGCEANAGPVSVFQIPTITPEVIVLDPFLCEGETTELILEDESLYTSPEWSIVQNNGTILSTDLTNDTIEVTSGTYQISVIDGNNCPGSTQVLVNEEFVFWPNLNFAPLCDENEICWQGGYTDPQICQNFIYLSDSGADSWEGAYLEVYVDDIGPFIYSLDAPYTFLPFSIAGYFGQVITYEFVSGLDDSEIGFQLFNTDNDIVYDTAVDGIPEEGNVFFTQVVNCPVNEIPGTWTSSCPEGIFDDPTTFNTCYSAPEGFLGECELTFDSDVCEEEISFTLTFSTLPTVEAFDYLNQCGDVLIEPVYSDPLPPDVIFDWTPNLNDGFPTATATSSIPYTITVGTETGVCGSNEASGIVQIIPIPNPQLLDAALCQGESVTLDSGLGSGTNITWTGTGVEGATSSSVMVTESGTYTVTGTNDCGTESASANVSIAITPSLTQFPFDTLVCVDDEITLNPNWNADGPISWVLSYTDTLGVEITETLGETGESLVFMSSMIPDDSESNSVVIMTSYSNLCGAAQSEIVIGSDACFVIAANVFTPDSDGSQDGFMTGGLNEGWQIIGIDGVSGVDVKVFDRWGALVYENNNYRNDQPWTGKHTNGSDLVEGVYFYKIKTPKGEKEIQGSVTILRK